MSAQIAQHNIECQISSNGDGIGAHQATCNIVWKAQHLLQSLPILLVHNGQHATGHLIWQFLQNVGNVVIIELFYDFCECFRFAINECGVAEFIRQLIDNQCFLIGTEQTE